MHTCVHVCKHANTHTLTVTLYTPAIVNHSRFPGTLPLYFHKWIFFLCESPVYATSLFCHHHSNSYSGVKSHTHSLEVFPDLPSPGIVTFPPSVFWDPDTAPRVYQWMVNNSVHYIQYDHQFPNISFLLDRKLSKNWDLMLVVCIS